MVKKIYFILISLLLSSVMILKVNAAESITYRWIGSMWGDSGQSLNYGNGIGYTQDAFYSNQNNTKRVSFYFNSSASLSGGGVNIPNNTKYALMRFTMTTPSTLVTANYTSEFYLYNNWGGGQNCEVVSDFHNEINDPDGSNPDSGMLMRSIVLKCYLDKNATSLSGFAYQFTFAPMMATSNITIRSYLSGDIAFLYEETSMTDIETAINNIQITEVQTQQVAEDIKDTLNDSSVASNSEISNKFGDFDDFLPSNNTISSLISMPLTLFQSVLNSINGTCQPFSLGSLLGTNLTLPCINLSNYLGSSLWGVIDIMFSGLFIFVISKNL